MSRIYSSPGFKQAALEALPSMGNAPPVDKSILPLGVQKFIREKESDGLETSAAFGQVPYNGGSYPVIDVSYGGMTQGGSTLFSPGGYRVTTDIYNFNDDPYLK